MKMQLFNTPKSAAQALNYYRMQKIWAVISLAIWVLGFFIWLTVEGAFWHGVTVMLLSNLAALVSIQHNDAVKRWLVADKEKQNENQNP